MLFRRKISLTLYRSVYLHILYTFNPFHSLLHAGYAGYASYAGCASYPNLARANSLNMPTVFSSFALTFAIRSSVAALLALRISSL